jgi:hypothetical protein
MHDELLAAVKSAPSPDALAAAIEAGIQAAYTDTPRTGRETVIAAIARSLEPAPAPAAPAPAEEPPAE